MYEGLQQLEDGLIDYIEIIQTVKSMVKNKLRDNNFNVDKEVKDKLFYEIQDLQTYPISWPLLRSMWSGFNKLVSDTDEEFSSTIRDINGKNTITKMWNWKRQRVHDLEKTVLILMSGTWKRTQSYMSSKNVMTIPSGGNNE